MIQDIKTEISSFLTPKSDSHSLFSFVFNAMNMSSKAALLACVICTLKEFIGDNINCITVWEYFYKVETKENPLFYKHKQIETYCYFSGTSYTVLNPTDEDEVPHPGISLSHGKEVRVHSYYLWVPFVLALQAAVYYAPQWFWKNWMEAGKLRAMLGNLDTVTLELDRRDGRSQLKIPKHIVPSARYMSESLNGHTLYVAIFHACELVALLIALGNIFCTDVFLGGHFLYYGHTFFNFSRGDIYNHRNPLNLVFPKVTKCDWYKFGPTGNIQKYDALCVLPKNIINEHIFFFLWIVYMLTHLAVVVSVIYQILMMLSSKFRNWIIKERVSDVTGKNAFRKVESKLNYADWFMIRQLNRKMVSEYFNIWIIQLANEITK